MFSFPQLSNSKVENFSKIQAAIVFEQHCELLLLVIEAIRTISFCEVEVDLNYRNFWQCQTQ